MGTEKADGGKRLERQPGLTGHPKRFGGFLVGTELQKSWLEKGGSALRKTWTGVIWKVKVNRQLVGWIWAESCRDGSKRPPRVLR